MYYEEPTRDKEICMKHLDLFSGIGGFSLALDNIYGKENIEHIFCEIDPFCREVLKKHWSQAEIHGDIHAFVADAKSKQTDTTKQSGLHAKLGLSNRTFLLTGGFPCQPFSHAGRRKGTADDNGDGDAFATTATTQSTTSEPVLINGERVFLLTGGFPCQPFSHAGRRKGTSDDRYLWPEMYECIKLYQPRWIIAENVAGLASWNEGLVLEQVCTDLEKEGYEVQPFVIPAVAVGAPHRRDRIWFVAHCKGESRSRLPKRTQEARPELREQDSDAPDIWLTSQDIERERPSGWHNGHRSGKTRGPKSEDKSTRPDTARDRWSEDWLTVAARLCRVDDGIPRRMDRNLRLKALGNAIVPQVAEEIIKAIKEVDYPTNK